MKVLVTQTRTCVLNDEESDPLGYLKWETLENARADVLSWYNIDWDTVDIEVEEAP